jgi:hypothetical protein
MDESGVHEDDFQEQCERCAHLEIELEAAKSENEILKRKSRLSSPSRTQPIRHVVIDESQIVIRQELASLQADLDDFAGRGPHNTISDKMKLKIVSSLTQNHLSMRQIEAELKNLSHHIQYFQKYNMPSRRPIQAVAYSIASLNLQQSVSFLESSKSLWIGFDGSTKMSKSIQAVVLINGEGVCHCLEAFETADGTAEALATKFCETFVNLALLGEREGLINESAVVWSKNQISKISMIMSDSCAHAMKTKSLLGKVIKDISEDSSMVIFEGDCSMHLVSNAEKQMAKCLSQSTEVFLKTIKEVLASQKGTATFIKLILFIILQYIAIL